MVLAPVVRGRKGEYGKLFEEMRAQGYARAVVDGELRRLDEEGGIVLDKKFKHDISVVVDRLVMKEGVRKRLAESIEAAAALAEGLVEIELLTAAAEAIEGADEEGPGAQVLCGPSAGKRGEVLVFSEKFACLNCGASMPELEPRIFSFNSPHGCCPRCHGLGFQRVIDPELIVPDPTLSISEGALEPWTKAASMYHKRLLEAVAEANDIDTGGRPGATSPRPTASCCSRAPATERHTITYRNRFGRRRTYTVRFDGMLHSLQRRYENTDSDNTRERVEALMALQPCSACHGARLRPESLAVTVGGLNIYEYTQLSARAALEWIRELELTETERAIARLVVREIGERLRFLDSVGIGYLSLERAATTLSGGEAQRIRLATQIGSSLVGVLYILDEPSIGLHQRDNERLIATLERLRDIGNTVIVVEHDEGTIRAADHVVDIGPGAGEHGGEIVAEGTAGGDRQDARIAHRPVPLRRARDRGPGASAASPTASWSIRGARQHNLKGIDVSFPLGVFTAVTGVSGSGKSTLDQRDPLPLGRQPPAPGAAAPRRARRIEGIDRIDKIINIDQSPIGRTPRSNPATYTGVFDHIRAALRRHPRGAGARLQARAVLLQRQGRALRGLPGRRPDQDRDALPARRLRPLRAVPRPALQPRDARDPVQGQVDRRRARDAGRRGGRVLLADPEDPPPARDAPRRRARLHPARPAGDDALRRRGAAGQARDRALEDRDRQTPSTSSTSRRPGSTSPTSSGCSSVLDRLVDQGNTVLVIEHNLDVIKTADRIIDLGPEGGDAGGELVATGTPEQVAGIADSYTGRFLADLVKAEEPAPKPRRTKRRREPVAA